MGTAVACRQLLGSQREQLHPCFFEEGIRLHILLERAETARRKAEYRAGVVLKLALLHLRIATRTVYAGYIR